MERAREAGLWDLISRSAIYINAGPLVTVFLSRRRRYGWISYIRILDQGVGHSRGDRATFMN